MNKESFEPKQMITITVRRKHRHGKTVKRNEQMTVGENLLVIIHQELYTSQNILEHITTPEFENAEKVHDWRNYIPKPLQSLRTSLSEESRLVAYLFAERQAEQEEWD